MKRTALIFNSIEECREKFPLNSNAWELAESPLLWCTVEEFQGVKAQVDIAYGAIRIIRGTHVLSEGKYMCSCQDDKIRIVCLDTEYYSVSKYLWI